jgi:hypothetical protein
MAVPKDKMIVTGFSALKPKLAVRVGHVRFPIDRMTVE